jgi:squalene synthase HpnC
VPVEHYENFPVASWLLPKHLRRPIEIIYHFARNADDFADEGNLSVADRLIRLGEYRNGLDRIAANAKSAQPLFSDLAVVIRQYDLPLQLFRDLLDAFTQDVTKTRYADFAELLGYCRRSANPIGRLLLHLNGIVTPQNLAWSDSICSALQLINHWQDVAIDWTKNDGGRVYLPQDELAQFGLTDDDIANQTNNDAMRTRAQHDATRATAWPRDARPHGGGTAVDDRGRSRDSG